MHTRVVWILVFGFSAISYTLIAAFGPTGWSWLFMLPPLFSAFSAFGFLYAKGSGVPETENARRPNR